MNNDFIVIGNPIEHSLSPRIHQLFAEQCGISLRYEKKLSDHEHFESDLRLFLNSGGRGLNVTVPFKVMAYQFADDHTERAEIAGACNTLMRRENGEILGDNTDGIGLVRDLQQRLEFQLKGARVLILGAGGAVRGILGPLFDSKINYCTIATREPQKAQGLKDLFPVLNLVEYRQIPEESFDLIINATSAGLSNELPPLPPRCIQEQTVIYDLTYGPKAEPFLIWCREQGAKYCYDGIGMLVEQAAASFLLWHGVLPKTAEVIETLLKEITCTNTSPAFKK